MQLKKEKILAADLTVYYSFVSHKLTSFYGGAIHVLISFEIVGAHIKTVNNRHALRSYYSILSNFINL